MVINIIIKLIPKEMTVLGPFGFEGTPIGPARPPGVSWVSPFEGAEIKLRNLLPSENKIPLPNNKTSPSRHYTCMYICMQIYIEIYIGIILVGFSVRGRVDCLRTISCLKG